MRRWRIGAAVAYASIVGAVTGATIEAEISERPGQAVDATGLYILAMALAFPAGAAVARWWAVLLPLVAVPFSLPLVVVLARKDEIALEDGLHLAFLIPVYACPLAAAGVLLAKAGAALARRRHPARSSEAVGSALAAIGIVAVFVLVWPALGGAVAALGLALLALSRRRHRRVRGS